MRDIPREQYLGRVAIASAAVAVLLMAAWLYGAGADRPRPLPMPALKHGVAFRLRQMEGRS